MLKSSNPRYSHYEQIKKIGEGTFASVYMGFAISKTTQTQTQTQAQAQTQTQTQQEQEQKTRIITNINSNIKDAKKKKIAIKRIKMGMYKEGLDMGALREIQYLKSLEHQNILELIDIVPNQDNMGISLILEFLETDLEVIIKNRKLVFSGADVKSWMIMLFRGLWFCHQSPEIRFILHRDLKPNNLLIGADGTLKIADFGLARSFGDPSVIMTSQVVTRWYRAPELLLGAKHYGQSVDIWSCGCIFAELMLRTPYFAAETDIGQLNTIFRARGTPTETEWPGMKLLPDCFEFTSYPTPPLRSIFSAASADALDLLDKCLDYNPNARPACKKALLHAYFVNIPRPTPAHRLPGAAATNSLKRKATETDLEDDIKASKLARKLF